MRSELLADCLPPHRATPQSASSSLPATRFLSTVKAPRQAATGQHFPCSPCSVWFLKDRSPLGQWGRILSSRKVWFPIFKSNLGSQLGSLLFPASPAPMPSPLKLMTDRAFDAFTPKGVIISKSEKPGQVYQKEDDLPKGLPKEATVLGVSPSPYRGNPGKNIMNVSRPQSAMDLGDSFFLPP